VPKKGEGAILHETVNKQANQRRQEWQNLPSNHGAGKLAKVAM
jgi:hypothetical protein